MSHTILNIEPAGYSRKAREMWERAGAYCEGSLEDSDHAGIRARTTILIVRLSRRIDESVLTLFPSLKWVVSATTGLDHIDLDALVRANVRLLSLRDENEFLSSIPSTAEHTMALMLGLVRRIHPAATSVERGRWKRDEFRGRQLKGRRLGVIGLGRTGRMVANYATAFGMNVGYFDPHVECSSLHRFASLGDLLRESEIISLHVHLDATTRGLLGIEELLQLRNGAFIINTSRGALVDEAALAARVRSGNVGGVATDVLASELDDIKASPLWQAMHDGLPVLITPHLGGATEDAMHLCEEFIAAKFLENRLEEACP